jgi:hypothetical protein
MYTSGKVPHPLCFCSLASPLVAGEAAITQNTWSTMPVATVTSSLPAQASHLSVGWPLKPGR